MLTIDSIESLNLDSNYKLHVDAKPRRYIEQKDFQVYVVDEDKCMSNSPVVRGVYSTGRKSMGIRGWMDIEYFENANFKCGRTLNLPSFGLDISLFRVLGRLIPDGGSIMVAYQMFWGRSSVHEETDRLLQHSVPPELTPIGFLLLHAGCLSFKDWYWPEGGREGPQKLQGFKPINQEQAQINVKRINSEVENFLTKETELLKSIQGRTEKTFTLLRTKSW